MLKPQKILLIDSNRTARYILAQQLSAWGMQVSQHSSVNEFLEERSQSLRYDLLFIRAESVNRNAVTLLAPRIITISDEPLDSDKNGEFTLRWPIDLSQLHNFLAQTPDFAPPDRSTQVESAGRVLIVDDYANNAILVEFALSDMPIRVVHIESGDLLLNTLDRERYDLILMDMQMPIMDGRELTRLIRASGKPYHDIPIVAFTASMMREQRAEYLAAGVNDILGKPFSVADLRRVIERWVRLRADKSTQMR